MPESNPILPAFNFTIISWSPELDNGTGRGHEQEKKTVTNERKMGLRGIEPRPAT
jgi:hypothetical protein